MKRYFAVFQGYIVTANSDGSIPLNAKVVAKLTCAADLNEDLLRQLIKQANETADRRE